MDSSSIQPLLYTLVGAGVVHGVVGVALFILRRGAFPLIGREVSFVVALAVSRVVWALGFEPRIVFATFSPVTRCIDWRKKHHFQCWL